MKILLVVFREQNSFGAIRSFYYCLIEHGQIEPGHCYWILNSQGMIFFHGYYWILKQSGHNYDS